MSEDARAGDGEETRGGSGAGQAAGSVGAGGVVPLGGNGAEHDGSWPQSGLFLVSVLVGVGAAVALAGGQTVGTGAVVGGFLILAVPKLLRTTGKSRASEPLYGWARILGFLAGFLAVSTMFAPALVDTWNEYAPSSPASARPVDPLTAEGLRSALDALGTAGFGSRYHELTIDERTVRATVASAGGARQVTFRDGRVTDAPESMTPPGPATISKRCRSSGSSRSSTARRRDSGCRAVCPRSGRSTSGAAPSA